MIEFFSSVHFYLTGLTVEVNNGLSPHTRLFRQTALLRWKKLE